MKKIENPLSLSAILLNAHSQDSEIAVNYPGEELFDLRHDFLMGPEQSSLAVLMIFANERSLMSNPQAGVRRKISVSLINATEKTLIRTNEMTVSMGKYDETKSIRVDFPFLYYEINQDHTYKVRVRDENSHKILGEKSFLMFDEDCNGKIVSEWFDFYEGGISPYYMNSLHRSYCSENMYYNIVRFNLHTAFKKMPLILPEVEVRVYYPNGEIESRFRQIECYDFDTNEYYIEMPFFVTEQNKGVCYAEVICLDYPVAGIVFSTSVSTVYSDEPWRGEDLRCLEEYSLDAAVSRFQKTLQPEQGQVADTDSQDREDSVKGDDFDRLLDEFIASQNEEKEDESSEVTTEAETDTVEEETPEPESESNDDSLLKSLANLTGLSSVKAKLINYDRFVRFNNMRRNHGLAATDIPLHAMFLGSPGTGKTTVAKKMGLMLRKAGLLSKGHVVVKERANLIGKHYSDEETNTLKAIEEAKGGILFIDEAYQLYQPDDTRDPGKFVIETLLTTLADESNRDWMLILAGYPEEMRRMFDMNPGFKSRIPESNIYLFEDFTESQLMEIAERYLERNDYSLSPEAREVLEQRLAKDYASRNKSFGNARHVINLIQTEIIPAMATRVMNMENLCDSDLAIIKSSDIPTGIGAVTTPKFNRIGYRA